MKGKFWVCNKVSATTAEILMYGYIGEYEEINDAEFISDLRKLESSHKNINLRINCGGGDVHKGLAIFNAIKNSKANIEGYVDGIAASMGAVMAVACNKLYMSKYARYMTHRVKGGIFGDSDKLRAFAKELDALEDIIAKVLTERTGLSLEATKAKYIVSEDRWIGAEQAFKERLINGIYDAEPVELPSNNFNSKQLYNSYSKAFNKKTFNMDFKSKIVGILKLDANASDDNIVEAIQTMVNSADSENERRVDEILDNAVKERKIAFSDKSTYKKMGIVDVDGLRDVISRMPAIPKPTDIINASKTNPKNTNKHQCVSSPIFRAIFS